ncbi:MAG: GFA family protein [Solirubrobacterales bacterium]
MESTKSSSADSEFETLTGTCMCGTVKFEVNAPMLGAALCWCKRCQRRTGTAFSATGLTQVGSFSVTEGKDVLRTYEPGDGGFNKSFCSNCGGQICTSSPDNPDIIAIRLGALDNDPGIRPGAHQFVTYASDWFPVPNDGLPRFPERLDWSAVLNS